ncbi:NmrA family NAD(P)-binding protein [Pseudochryseolinea flava]|uniref:NAD-dependent dehydratase n=1 Tax=Pseudochryseolinea flava TaxID=2059302 RepID=A0A364XYI3_9BACT|nr:NmrA family NAD(P)-binding protein [Pseudochryseolinea flava]RAV98486.1 NAD-dependent dehydratase [Pseudochryseolinea flava]
MKTYVITGSIGHISKPVVEALVKAGNKVRVVTSNHDRVKDIESLGASAVVGSVFDAAFVSTAFKGADVIYTMIPPIWQTTNWRASQNEVAKNYADAIRENKIAYVVNLSSVGAHAGNGVGPVDGLYDFEQLLNKISGLNVKHLRPSYFYYNLLNQIGLVKQAGILGGNFGDGEKVFLVHTRDIAAAALEELTTLKFSGASVRYIFGDERSGKEIASVLGKAIGREVNWVVFSDEEQKQGLLQAGVPEIHAQAYTEMGKAIRDGLMQGDARKHKPTLSPTKLEDFATEFAQAYAG